MECFTPCDGTASGPAAILGSSVFVLWICSRGTHQTGSGKRSSWWKEQTCKRILGNDCLYFSLDSKIKDLFFSDKHFCFPPFSALTLWNLLHTLDFHSPELNTLHFFRSQKDPNRFDRDRLFSAVSRGSPEALDGLLEYLRRTSKFLTNSEYTGRLLLSTPWTGLAEAVFVNVGGKESNLPMILCFLQPSVHFCIFLVPTQGLYCLISYNYIYTLRLLPLLQAKSVRDL